MLSYPESLGEDSGVEGEEECVYYREPVRICARQSITEVIHPCTEYEYSKNEDVEIDVSIKNREY